MDNVAFIRKYLKLIEEDAPAQLIGSCFHEDVVQSEFPNKITPNGARRNLRELLEANEKGKMVIADQRYVIRNIVESKGDVAMEITWTGKLKIPLGDRPAGHEMKAEFGVFFKMKDGKIASQKNYDCFYA